MKTKLNVKKFWRFWDTWGVFVIFVIVAAIFGCIDPRVLQGSQLVAVMNRSSWIAVMAAGMAFAICTGGFDLATGSMFSLCGALLAGFIMKSGMSSIVAILAVIGVALVLSLINGLLISKLKIVPFVATLGTQLIFDSLAQVYTSNNGINIATANYQGLLETLGRGNLLGVIPNKLVIVAIVYAVAILVYRSTKLGTQFY